MFFPDFFFAHSLSLSFLIFLPTTLFSFLLLLPLLKTNKKRSSATRRSRSSSASRLPSGCLPPSRRPRPGGGSPGGRAPKRRKRTAAAAEERRRRRATSGNGSSSGSSTAAGRGPMPCPTSRASIGPPLRLLPRDVRPCSCHMNRRSLLLSISLPLDDRGRCSCGRLLRERERERR